MLACLFGNWSNRQKLSLFDKFPCVMVIFSINELIAFRNVDLSINHKNEDLLALIDADLGDEYIRDSSPKPYPDYNFF